MREYLWISVANSVHADVGGACGQGFLFGGEYDLLLGQVDSFDEPVSLKTGYH